ncbi:conserved oligomeric Golgi complex subunit 6, partial [Tanacetum coccineum]
IAKSLSNCNATTGDIITTTERLKQELEVTTQRQEIASCFLRDYQLSNEEINALREEELNENFFKALNHVQTIHANCKVLLRTHHQVPICASFHCKLDSNRIHDDILYTTRTTYEADPVQRSGKAKGRNISELLCRQLRLKSCSEF